MVGGIKHFCISLMVFLMQKSVKFVGVFELCFRIYVKVSQMINISSVFLFGLIPPINDSKLLIDQIVTFLHTFAYEAKT